VLQGGSVHAVRELVSATGMSGALNGFGLPTDRLIEIVRFAPATRPGRFTVLDASRPDGTALRAAIEKVTQF
jgi:glycerol dehydrogenase-like iron-containing ADH family enzyme